MKNEISCRIIKDLLPIYIDGLGSEESNLCVKEHLNNCDYCRKECNKISRINNSNNNNNEKKVLIKFKIKIKLIFISVIIISAICISLSIMCNKIQFGWDIISVKEAAGIIIINIGSYFIPMIALLLCWVWKKVSYGSSSYNISSVFFISFLIIVIAIIMNLVFRYVVLLNTYVCLLGRGV